MARVVIVVLGIDIELVRAILSVEKVNDRRPAEVIAPCAAAALRDRRGSRRVSDDDPVSMNSALGTQIEILLLLRFCVADGLELWIVGELQLRMSTVTIVVPVAPVSGSGPFREPAIEKLRRFGVQQANGPCSRRTDEQTSSDDDVRTHPTIVP